MTVVASTGASKIIDKFRNIKNTYFPKGCYYGVKIK